MEKETKWHLVRTVFGEYSRGPNGPLYSDILNLAKQMHLDGATVLKGAEGFSATGGPGSNFLWGGREKSIPLIVETVVMDSKKTEFLDKLRELIKAGGSNATITISESEVVIGDPDRTQ